MTPSGLYRTLAAILILAGSVLALVRLRHRSSHDDGRPNILLVSLCSVRSDHMGTYGYSRNTTPAIDAFGDRAIVFEHAVSPWPKTAPAFAAIMTGRFGHDTGVKRITPGQKLHASHQTLAEVLSENGYDTAAFISSAALHGGTQIHQGFDRVEETFRSKNAYAETTRAASSWMRRSADRPFFAWVHYNSAHYPYQGGGGDADQFIGDASYDSGRRVRVNRREPLPLSVPSDHPCRRQILRPDLGGVHAAAVMKDRPTELDCYVARYDAGIRSADEQVGQLLTELRKVGVADNTIVVIVGDHGESLGEHDYYFEHGRFPYDACARVPLMVKPVDARSGSRVAHPVSTLGVAPTVLEMAGIRPPAAMECDSLLNETASPGTASYVFSESGYQMDYMLSVRDQRWKLIHIPNAQDRGLMQRSEYELYDLRADAAEIHNRFAEEREVAVRLQRVLSEWSADWIEHAYTTHAVSRNRPSQAIQKQLRTLGYVD